MGTVFVTVRNEVNFCHFESTAEVELISFIMSDADLRTFWLL